MEVHPPEHPIHTWRDFLIHIATIVIGLLIAVGLEQAVEFAHHRHQRHQMLEDIREEGEGNAKICRNMQFFSEAESSLLDAWAEDLRSAPAVNGSVRVTVSPSIREKEKERMRRLHLYRGQMLPTIPVWDTAREFAQLMPMMEPLHRADAVSKRTAFEKQFSTDDASGDHDFSRATEAQLQQYLRLLEEEKMDYRWWGSWAHQMHGAETAISHGERNLGKIQAAER